MFTEYERIFMRGFSFSVSAFIGHPETSKARDEKPSVQFQVPQGKFSASNYRKQYPDLDI